MIRISMIAALILAGSAGAALAGPMSNPPTERTICIDVGGQSLPAVCKVPASSSRNPRRARTPAASARVPRARATSG